MFGVLESFAYVELAHSGELARRAAEAYELLGPRCIVCPRGCKVDRRADVPGLCAIGRHAVVASYFPHFGEEDCLRGQRGSGTIFFSGCNLRCVFCLAPDSMVATERGPRLISEIYAESDDEVRVGDGTARRVSDLKVMTATGELAYVTKAFCHRYRGELIRLKPVSAPAVRLTPNHEVFAAHSSTPERVEKLPAGSLTSEHYVVVPKRAQLGTLSSLDVAGVLATHVSRPVWSSARPVEEVAPLLRSSRTSAEVASALGYHPAYIRTLRSRMRRGLWPPTGPQVRELKRENELVRFSGEHRPGIPSRVPLDAVTAWLLGVYAAEGSVRRLPDRPNSARLIFSFGLTEVELAEQTSDILCDLFGVRPVVVRRPTTLAVEVGKTSLALLFLNLCRTGAANKIVPAPVFAASEAVIRAFLCGYLLGDGSVNSRHFVGTTISRDLAHGLYHVGLLVGALPSIYRWIQPPVGFILGRRVRQSPLWFVKFKRDELQKTSMAGRAKWKDAGPHFLVPIHRIERELYDGDVYNLEVDHKSHSYVAGAIGVGNCQNHDISWQVRGEHAPSKRLAGMMLELQAMGCHNVNWVTPEHVVPQILEALPLAVDAGLRLPIVYNTSSYDSLDSLRLMEGVVDVYMPDFKLWTHESARRYLKRADYVDVARATISEMHRQVGDLVLDARGMARRGVILRHLVTPGLVAETEAILRWVAEELGPGCYVNLMAQYYVSGNVGKDGKYEEIARGIYREEYEQALDVAVELGLRLDPRSVGERRALARAG